MPTRYAALFGCALLAGCISRTDEPYWRDRYANADYQALAQCTHAAIGRGLARAIEYPGAQVAFFDVGLPGVAAGEIRFIGTAAGTTVEFRGAGGAANTYRDTVASCARR